MIKQFNRFIQKSSVIKPSGLIVQLAKSGVCATLIGLSGLSMAQQPGTYSSGYFGASVQSYDYRDASLQDVTPTAFRLQAGAEISEGLQIEAHYGIGLSEESTSTSSGPITLEIDNFRALYFKPSLPMNAFVEVYALAGYAEAKVQKTAFFSSSSTFVKEYGASYGFGVDMALASNSRLSIEYLRLLDEPSLDASSLGVGINLDF